MPTASDTTRLNRKSSEWAFQRFLQEATAATATPLPDDDVIEIKSNHHFSPPHLPKFPQIRGVSDLPEKPRRIGWRRHRFDTGGQWQGSSLRNRSTWKRVAGTSCSHNTSEGGLDSSKVEDMETGSSVGLSAEQSEDDAVEGETETTQNMDPAD